MIEREMIKTQTRLMKQKRVAKGSPKGITDFNPSQDENQDETEGDTSFELGSESELNDDSESELNDDSESELNDDSEFGTAIKRSRNIDEKGFDERGFDGGSCERVNSSKEAQLVTLKSDVEGPHDFGGSRSEDPNALYNGLSIKNVNDTNIYDKFVKIFDKLANDVVANVQAEAGVLTQTDVNIYENQFILDFGNDKPSNEPAFLNLTIEAMVKRCPDQIEDFYYQPIYEYTIKNYLDNQTIYNLFKAKIKEFYPIGEWRIFVKVKNRTKNGVNTIDLYIYVVKKTEKIALNTSLRFHSQDTGLSNYILGICLCEQGFNEAFDKLFNGDADIDIDKFIPKASNPADPADPANIFVSDIEAALAVIISGTITVDNATNLIDVKGSIQISGITKLIDPANVSKPLYGEIIKGVATDANKIEQIYIGYPATQPIIIKGSDPHPGKTSKTVFDEKIEEVYPVAANQKIKDFLIGFNNNAVESTLSAFNLLLSYWIIPTPGSSIVNDYNLVLNTNNIVGINLIGPEAFTFRLDIEDITVSNICKTMIHYFLNPGDNTQQIIQQMNKVFDHPKCRYKTMNPKLLVLDYKLAIIASFKSFGDECQRKEAEDENRYLNSLGGSAGILNENSKHLLMLSDDRIFFSSCIQHNQPAVSNTKSPHPKFYDIDSMPQNKIPNILGSITGLACNKLSIVGKSKPTIELLQEAYADIQVEYQLIKTKLGIGIGIDIPSIQAQITNLNLLITAITNAAAAAGNMPLVDYYKTMRSVADQTSDKTMLKSCKETIGKMKSTLNCLQYYYASFNDLTKKKQKDIYLKYINDELSSSISASVDSNTYKNIIDFNTGSLEKKQNINNVDNLTSAIKTMFNKIDFAPKLVSCHELACDQAIHKIQMYIQTLIIYGEILGVEKLQEIQAQYEEFIEKITDLRVKYPNTILESLNAYISSHMSGRQKNKTIAFGADNRSPEEINRDKLAKIDKALREAEVEKKAAEEAEKAAAGTAAAPPKGKKGFFEKALKAAKGFFKDTASRYDNLTKERNDLSEKITSEALKAAAAVHSTDKTEARTFQQWLEGFVNRGGSKSRQNKQQYQKRYTKRRNKKTYRKRTQKHLKIKRRRYTKRRK
jgi:hypothetical protein